MDGVIDVYFEEEIEILVDEPGEGAADKVRAVLTEREIEFSEVTTG